MNVTITMTANVDDLPPYNILPKRDDSLAAMENVAWAISKLITVNLERKAMLILNKDQYNEITYTAMQQSCEWQGTLINRLMETIKITYQENQENQEKE